MNLPEIKDILINHPSKEFLVEMVNKAEIANPILKSMVFMAMQSMSERDVKKFSAIAVVAIQYIEQGKTEELKDLCNRAGIPGPIATIINSYAANLTRQQ